MGIDLVIYQALAGLGACSLQVSLPIAQAYGLLVAPIASAVMTSSSAYPNFGRQICQCNLEKAAQQYKEIGITPKALLVGYVPSVELYREIYTFKELFPDCFIALDPVLGDNAKLYSKMDNELISHMRKLSKIANLLTPNLTEALLLAGYDLEQYGTFRGLSALKANLAAMDLVQNIALAPEACIALKGWQIRKEDDDTAATQYASECIGRNYLFKHEKMLYADFAWQAFAADKNYFSFSGTGDLFAAAIVASFLLERNWEKALLSATEIASLAVSKCIGRLEKTQAEYKAKLQKTQVSLELDKLQKQGIFMPEVLASVTKHTYRF